MTDITLVRTDHDMPPEADLEKVRAFLFGLVDGARQDDKRAWRKFWKRVLALGVGEFINFEVLFPRLGPYHRRHMKIENDVFDAQDRFTDFEQFRVWLKVGAGWVDWCAGPKGGVIPVPRSISYRKADQAEFERYHGLVMEFLRGEHAAPYLWKHLGELGAHAMMDTIMAGFGE